MLLVTATAITGIVAVTGMMPGIVVFGCVAFKYQPEEPDPPVAAAAALVTLARRHFNERVALIAARAFSSWLVAIAVMLLALSFRQAGA